MRRTNRGSGHIGEDRAVLRGKALQPLQGMLLEDQGSHRCSQSAGFIEQGFPRGIARPAVRWLYHCPINHLSWPDLSRQQPLKTFAKFQANSQENFRADLDFTSFHSGKVVLADTDPASKFLLCYIETAQFPQTSTHCVPVHPDQCNPRFLP